MANDPHDPYDSDHERGHGTALEESRPEVKQPPLYKVVLLNDDYTPMEFVVDILQRFFRLDRPNATRVMRSISYVS